MSSSTFLHVYGLICIVLAAVVIPIRIARIVAGRKKLGGIKLSQDTLILLALLYPLGNGLKYLRVGPEILRAHLADIGFPVAAALIFGLLVLRSAARHRTDLPGQPDVAAVREQGCLQTRAASISLVVGLLVSYAWEIFEGVVHARVISAAAAKGVDPLMGGFDPGDMIAYTIGAVLAAVAVIWMSRAYAWRIVLLEQMAQEAETQKRRLARERRVVTPRKKLRPGSRKGGRI